MNLPVVVIFLIGVCLISSVKLFFSTSRSEIGVSSIILSACLILVIFYLLSSHIVLIVTPIFLIIDLIILHYIFYTNLYREQVESKRLRMITTTIKLFAPLAIFFVGMWFVWNTNYSVEFVMINNESSPIVHFWQTYWLYGVFCLLLLLPISIGALLMVKVGEK